MTPHLETGAVLEHVVAFRVTADEQRQLRLIARRDGVSVGVVVRRALRQEFAS